WWTSPENRPQEQLLRSPNELGSLAKDSKGQLLVGQAVISAHLKQLEEKDVRKIQRKTPKENFAKVRDYVLVDGKGAAPSCS
ncbi:MAG: hypothetical protein ABIR96_07170, partial [Bdellovibrionota bacterium]